MANTLGTRLLLFFVTCLSYGCGGSAVDGASPESNAELVRKSHLVWSAFRCSLVSTKATEETRLFTIGLTAGREFLKACGGTDRCDPINSEIPIVWRMVQYPSNDFALGQVYQQAADHSGKTIYETVNGAFPDKELIAIRRDTEYAGQNCTHLR
jgi:hypothetical protein